MATDVGESTDTADKPPALATVAVPPQSRASTPSSDVESVDSSAEIPPTPVPTTLSLTDQSSGMPETDGPLGLPSIDEDQAAQGATADEAMGSSMKKNEGDGQEETVVSDTAEKRCRLAHELIKESHRELSEDERIQVAKLEECLTRLSKLKEESGSAMCSSDEDSPSSSSSSSSSPTAKKSASDGGGDSPKPSANVLDEMVKLRKLSQRGLVTVDLRQRVWPLLLGVSQQSLDEARLKTLEKSTMKNGDDDDESADHADSSLTDREIAEAEVSSELDSSSEKKKTTSNSDMIEKEGQKKKEKKRRPSHPYYGVVRRDADRSMNHLDVTRAYDSATRKKEQKLLESLLHEIFITNPQLHYTQGFHDICTIFYILYGDIQVAKVMSEALAKRHLRDAVRDSLSSLVNVLVLIFPLVRIRGETELYDFLIQSEVSSMFCLSWILTWFAHNIDSFSDICRLYDLFLSSHPLMPMYLTCVILCELKSEFLKTAEDPTLGCTPGAVHTVLQNIDWQKFWYGAHDESEDTPTSLSDVKAGGSSSSSSSASSSSSSSSSTTAGGSDSEDIGSGFELPGDSETSSKETTKTETMKTSGDHFNRFEWIISQAIEMCEVTMPPHELIRKHGKELLSEKRIPRDSPFLAREVSELEEMKSHYSGFDLEPDADNEQVSSTTVGESDGMIPEWQMFDPKQSKFWTHLAIPVMVASVASVVMYQRHDGFRSACDSCVDYVQKVVSNDSPSQ